MAFGVDFALFILQCGDEKHLPTVAREHCLRSTSFHKPDYVFFKTEGYGDLGRKVDQVSSVFCDLDTVFVTSYGDASSVDKYEYLLADEFFLKKVAQRSVLHITILRSVERTIRLKHGELFTRSLKSAPKSSVQEPDHVSQNRDVCIFSHLTEKTSDQTLTHSLSYLREIMNYYPTSVLLSIVNNLHHVTRLSVLCLTHCCMGNRECQSLATALKYVVKLRCLSLSSNPLGHGISELAKHLHNVPHLEVLHLGDTQMAEEEVTALAHSLRNVT